MRCCPQHMTCSVCTRHAPHIHSMMADQATKTETASVWSSRRASLASWSTNLLGGTPMCAGHQCTCTWCAGKHSRNSRTLIHVRMEHICAECTDESNIAHAAVLLSMKRWSSITPSNCQLSMKEMPMHRASISASNTEDLLQPMQCIPRACTPRSATNAAPERQPCCRSTEPSVKTRTVFC